MQEKEMKIKMQKRQKEKI